jgi:hypothetical protein
MRDRTKTPKRFRPKAIPELSNHAFLQAEKLFTSGRIPVAQAVGMMLSDCDFIAECEMSGRDKRLHAECIVRDQWARRLLEVSNG